METPRMSAPEESAVAPSSTPRNDTWGIFEPVHGVLGPAVDIVRPFISANVVIGFLILLQLLTWLRGRSSANGGRVGFSQMLTSERVATYEEIWQREEVNMWDWLEERIGMEEQIYPISKSSSASASADDRSDYAALRKARSHREQSWKHRDMQRRSPEEEALSGKELAQAIRATERRLAKLKTAAQKKRLKQRGQGRGHDEN